MRGEGFVYRYEYVSWWPVEGGDEVGGCRVVR